MDGVLNIRKEKGYTSFDVVAKLRGILHMKKIGHRWVLSLHHPILFPVTTIIIMELFINKMRRLKGIRKMIFPKPFRCPKSLWLQAEKDTNFGVKYSCILHIV